MLPYTFGLKKDGPVTSASEITLLKMIEIHCSKHIQKWVRLRASFSYDLWTFSISKFCFFLRLLQKGNNCSQETGCNWHIQMMWRWDSNLLKEDVVVFQAFFRQGISHSCKICCWCARAPLLPVRPN